MPSAIRSPESVTLSPRCHRLILCAGKADERIELLELESSGIRVAQYLTELPPKEILERRFHEAIVAARSGLAG